MPIYDFEMVLKDIKIASTNSTPVAKESVGKDNRGMSEEGPTDQAADPPAGQRRVVIRPRLFRALASLVEDRETDLTEEVNRAVREMLERENRWPPRTGQTNTDTAGLGET